MKEFVQFILQLLSELFGGIRDKERSAEVQQDIADKRDRADAVIRDMSVADRDAVLERLHRHGSGGSTSSGTNGADATGDTANAAGHTARFAENAGA